MKKPNTWDHFISGAHNEIAQELRTSRDKRKWAAIYGLEKLDLYSLIPHGYSFLIEALATPKAKFSYIEFEMTKRVLEFNDGIDDRDAIIQISQTFENEQNLKIFLENRRIDVALFLPFWRCDYPLD